MLMVRLGLRHRIASGYPQVERKAQLFSVTRIFDCF